MDVLRRDLNLIIDDFGEKPELHAKIKDYHSLLADYMVKRGHTGMIHVAGAYLPFM